MDNAKDIGKSFMGSEPLHTLLPRLALPMMVAQALSLLYNIADRAFIGHIPDVGTAALAGVGVCFPVAGVIVAFANWAGMGAAPKAAMAIGAGDRQDAQARLARTEWLLAVFAALLLVIVYAFMEPILTALGCSTETLPYGMAYLRIFAISIPLTLIVMGLNPFLLAQGDSRISMLALGAGNLLNVGLDYVLIFWMGMGVEGAAAASVISQGVSAAMVVWGLVRRGSFFRLCIPRIPTPRQAGDTLLMGSGPFFTQATEQVLYTAFNLILVTTGGDSYIAVYAVFVSVQMLTMAMIMGFTQGVQPVISYCLGAGLRHRAARVIKVAVTVSVVLGAVLTLPSLVVPELYLQLFSSDPAMVEVGAQMLPIYNAGMMVFGAQIAIQSAFMACGKGVHPLIVASARKLVFLIPIALLLSWHMGAIGVFIAEPISDTLSVAFACIFFYFSTWRPLFRTQK